MLGEKVREYFSFTRKERIGVLILIFLILLIFIFPYFFEFRKNKTDQQSLEQFKDEIARLKLKQQDNYVKKDNETSDNDEENNSLHYDPVQQNKYANKDPLFYFDPNTISGNEWKQLGIRDKTIHTIQHYLAKGGRFKIPADLKKVYGIHEDDYDRLQPFIKIKNTREKNNIDPVDNIIKEDHSLNKAKDFPIVDINTADSVSFIALRGIGNKLASRIIHFRERLGGFYAVDQIAEVYGLPDSVFLAIKPFLRIKNDSVNKIDINTADINILKQHPYIRWELAKAIVAYRNQHGFFKKPEDLLQVAIIRPVDYNRISFYIKIN